MDSNKTWFIMGIFVGGGAFILGLAIGQLFIESGRPDIDELLKIHNFQPKPPLSI